MFETFVFVGNTEGGMALSQSLIEKGLKAAGELEHADVVLVYTDSQTELEDVFFDTKGLVQTSSKESVLINLSSSTPSFARELNAVALVSELHVVEAPLSVKDPTLDKALSRPSNLTCFVAGEDADVERAVPFLHLLVETVEVTGLPGSAQLAQAALTVQRSAQLVATMETQALYQSFAASSGNVVCFAHEQGMMTEANLSILEAIEQERFKGSYTVQMWLSDLTAALMAADDVDLILPGAEACMHLLELLVVIGGGSLSPAALSLVYGDEATCAKHGLDWTRAEQTYHDEEEFGHSHDCDCGHDHSHDDFTGGFGAYSSN